MTIRLRLTLLYLVLLTISLSICGIAGYAIASNRIYSSVDESLGVRSEALLRLFGNDTSGLNKDVINAAQPELGEQASADLVFQIRGPDGQVLYSSAEPLSSSLPPPESNSAVRSFSTREVAGVDLRILYQPVTNGGNLLGTIEVAQSLKPTSSALGEIRTVLIIVGIAAAALTTITAYSLAGNALKPVREVSNMARQIEQTSDFARRLSVSRTRDEVSELMVTFNAMIDRVEETMLGQREFLADSSHELRRPLTVVRTNLDVLSNPALPEAQRRECIEEIRLEAGLMSKLIGDLLLLAREESQTVQRSPVDLSELCRRTAARYGATDGEHTIVGDYDAAVIVSGDPDRLEQLLENLLENAFVYSTPGTPVGLSLHQTDGHASLDVSSQGEGIPPDELLHVFERFFRGDTARELRPDGSGLGLAIVKYVAEAHDGTAEVSSVNGATRFRITLPTCA